MVILNRPVELVIKRNFDNGMPDSSIIILLCTHNG